MSQDIKIVDKLDPSAVNDREGLADFLGNTRTVLKQLDGDLLVLRSAYAVTVQHAKLVGRLDEGAVATYVRLLHQLVRLLHQLVGELRRHAD